MVGALPLDSSMGPSTSSGQAQGERGVWLWERDSSSRGLLRMTVSGGGCLEGGLGVESQRQVKGSRELDRGERK